ncbi:MAG: 3'-5' exonuclease [Pseudomonadota bacterium]|nr:MAG: 3'-5' exonuclease [Pseudomonadota bacterium]
MRHGELPGCFPTGRHYPGIAHLLRVVASGLCEEFPSEHPVSDLRIVAIDTETTGRDPAVDRIVEIACVVWANGDVVERKSWLVNPGRPIPKEAFDVHGISDDDVRDKPSFAELAEEVLSTMHGAVPLAYNADYDRSVLSAEVARLPAGTVNNPPAARRNVDWIDPLVWARELHKYEKSKALGEVSQRLGIAIPQAHRAEHDAEAALRVMLAFAVDPRVPRTYGALMQEQRRLARLHEEERRLWRSRAPAAGATAAPQAASLRDAEAPG